MPVHMMHVGDVRMLVRQSLVTMPVCMRLSGRIVGAVYVLVVLVVHMLMLVRHRLVDMLVFMNFRHVQPYAHRHQGAGGSELNRDWFGEQQDRSYRAEERGSREVCAGPRRTKISERADEQDKADAISDEADEARYEHRT